MQLRLGWGVRGTRGLSGEVTLKASVKMLKRSQLHRIEGTAFCRGGIKYRGAEASRGRTGRQLRVEG